MMDDSRTEMTRWEDEGGSLASAAPTPDEPHEAPVHVLPAGYEEQPIRGFHDPSGRFSYHFHHVYGPPLRRDRRGPIRQLDQPRSYWEMTWSTHVRTADQRLAGRSMSYGEARKLRGPSLTFDQFSSMRLELPGLLGSAT